MKLSLALAALFCPALGRAQAAQAGDQPAPAAAGRSCLVCHAPIRTQLEKQFRHAALDDGCVSCHANHRDPSAAPAEAPHHLRQSLPALCGNCHDFADQRLVEAHRGQPFGKAVCTRCHEPHASNAPKLLLEAVHGPFGARQCGACHVDPVDGRVRFALATVNSLCLGCHEELAKRLNSSKHVHSLLALEPNSCIDCHDPHAGKFGHALKAAYPDLCARCHAGILTGGRFQHEPVRVSCVFCHDAHASDNPNNLHAEANRLCLGCHGENAVRIVQADTPTALFDGRVALPPRTFGELRWLQVKPEGERGHPFPNHPVFEAGHDGERGITCLSCHRPHSGEGGRRRFVTGSPIESKLCVKCH